MNGATLLHFVYVANEDGLSKIFTGLKQKLFLQNNVTLIYISSNDSFVFDKELEIFEKRYPSQFIWYRVREKLVDASSTIQELLEAVINSSTEEHLIFVLSPNEELIHIVSNRLWFLGVSKTQIQTL